MAVAGTSSGAGEITSLASGLADTALGCPAQDSRGAVPASDAVAALTAVSSRTVTATGSFAIAPVGTDRSSVQEWRPFL